MLSKYDFWCKLYNMNQSGSTNSVPIVNAPIHIQFIIRGTRVISLSSTNNVFFNKYYDLT